MKKTVVLTLMGLGILTSCGSITPQAQLNVLEQGKPVPNFIGQSVSVAHQLQVNKLDASEIGALHAHTILFKDPLGYDFVQLISTAPREINDPVDFGLGVTDSEIQSNKDQWYTAVVGASTIRNVITSQSPDIETLRALARTVQKIGKGNVAGYVAFSSARFTVKDTRGDFWDISTQEKLTPDQVELFTTAYRNLVKNNSTADFVEAAEGNWQNIVPSDHATVNRQAARYEDAQGNLDFKKVAEQIDTFKVTGKPTQETLATLQQHKTPPIIVDKAIDKQQEAVSGRSCMGFLWWSWCWDSEYTGNFFKDSLNQTFYPISGGWAQQPWMFDDNTDQTYSNMGTCVTAGIKTYTGPLGCAGSSGIAIADWLWHFKNEKFFGNAYDKSYDPSDEYKPDQSGFLINKPQALYTRRGNLGVFDPSIKAPAYTLGRKQSSGRALIQDYMGTCTLRDTNGFTTPWGFEAGMNRFFYDQHHKYGTTHYYMEGQVNYFYDVNEYLPWINNSFRMANVIRRGVGVEAMPTIAIYQIGEWWELHYSPILSYRVFYNGARAIIWIKTVDSPRDWTLMNDPWRLAYGAYRTAKP